MPASRPIWSSPTNSWRSSKAIWRRRSKLVNAAHDQREERIAELLGGGKANPAPPGLVAEITEADDQRNASLVEVDRLRRDISAAEQNVRRLIQENNDLARILQSRLAPKLTALSDPLP